MADAGEQDIGGVGKLIARIRDEGVGAAREEAERIIAAARDEAAQTRESARNEAQALLEAARTQVAVEQQAGQAALRLAARDTLLELRATIRHDFEAFVSTMVTRETCDVRFVRDLVLVLAGHAAERFLDNKDLQMMVSADLLEGSATDEGTLRALMAARALELSSEALRRGIELFPASDISGGARVRLVGENLELDLSDEAISRMLLRFLLPRYQHIIEQAGKGS